jgi:hypothetical protein
VWLSLRAKDVIEPYFTTSAHGAQLLYHKAATKANATFIADDTFCRQRSRVRRQVVPFIIVARNVPVRRHRKEQAAYT